MTEFHTPTMLFAVLALTCLPLAACGSTTTGPPGTGGTANSGAGATATTASPQQATSSTVGDGTSSGGRACGLLTTGEAGAVLGQPVTATEQDQGLAHACRYKPADPTGGRVSVVLFDASAGDFATAADNQPTSGVPVSGLGEKAEFFAGEGLMLTYRSGHLLSVQVVHKGVRMGSATELGTLARSAAGRL